MKHLDDHSLCMSCFYRNYIHLSFMFKLKVQSELCSYLKIRYTFWPIRFKRCAVLFHSASHVLYSVNNKHVILIMIFRFCFLFLIYSSPVFGFVASSELLMGFAPWQSTVVLFRWSPHSNLPSCSFRTTSKLQDRLPCVMCLQHLSVLVRLWGESGFRLEWWPDNICK